MIFILFFLILKLMSVYSRDFRTTEFFYFSYHEDLIMTLLFLCFSSFVSAMHCHSLLATVKHFINSAHFTS